MGSISPPPSTTAKSGMTGVKKPWIETPLVESKALSKAAGCRIFLKLDNLQPASSFKSRGVGNVILQAILRHKHSSDMGQKLHFYSSSGGNAGLAAVTAATSLGYPSTVVVPMSTDEMMVARIKNAGASEVIQKGASWVNADAYLREELMKSREGGGEMGIYVPPFDHEDVWDGNATIISELEAQMPDGEMPDALVCSVGGGGLFSGLLRGLDRAGWGNEMTVLAIETKGADSLNAAVKARERVALPGITSLAKSLGAVRVCEEAFRDATERSNVESVVVSDAEACMGCWRLADDERLLVEPACGASVVVCYNGLLRRLVPGLNGKSTVVIVVCGGSDVTVERLVEYREKFGKEVEGLMTQDAKVPSSYTLP